MKKSIILLFVLTLIPVPAMAIFLSGNELLERCHQSVAAREGQTGVNYVMANQCVGYIQGVTDAFSQRELKTVCVPDDASINQVVDFVTRYLEGNPNLLHYSASSLTDVALRDLFPCK
jgi:hypothetical protein